MGQPPERHSRQQFSPAPQADQQRRQSQPPDQRQPPRSENTDQSQQQLRWITIEQPGTSVPIPDTAEIVDSQFDLERATWNVLVRRRPEEGGSDQQEATSSPSENVNITLQQIDRVNSEDLDDVKVEQDD